MSSWGRPRNPVGGWCSMIVCAGLILFALGACLVPVVVVWGLT